MFYHSRTKIYSLVIHLLDINHKLITEDLYLIQLTYILHSQWTWHSQVPHNYSA